MAENCYENYQLGGIFWNCHPGFTITIPAIIKTRGGLAHERDGRTVRAEGQQRDRIALTLVRVVVGLVGTSDFQGWLPSIVELKRRMRQD